MTINWNTMPMFGIMPGYMNYGSSGRGNTQTTGQTTSNSNPFGLYFGDYLKYATPTTMLAMRFMSMPSVPRIATYEMLPGFKFENFDFSKWYSQTSSSNMDTKPQGTGRSLWSRVTDGVKTFVGKITGFAKKFINIAKKYLGFNERDNSYKKFTQGRTEAWCADFVSYVARESGITGFNFASVQGILDWGRQHGKFHRTPQVGDVIIFKNCGASHTGIVTSISGGRIHTIEGNTSDKVAQRSYSLSDPKITGYVTLA